MDRQVIPCGCIAVAGRFDDVARIADFIVRL
jgi:hypothetical protein